MAWTCVTDKLPPVSKHRPDDVRAVSDDVLVSYWCGRSVTCVSRYVVPDDGRPYWVAPDPEMWDIEIVTHWQPLPADPPELPAGHTVERDGDLLTIVGDPEPGDVVKRSAYTLPQLYRSY